MFHIAKTRYFNYIGGNELIRQVGERTRRGSAETC